MWVDKRRIREMGLIAVMQPKLAFLPEGQRGGPRFLESCSRTGRTVSGNVGRGHFQDLARQLTSSACGRAIL